MPFRDSEIHLRDILSAIDDIQQFTEGMSAEAFQADAKTRAAVERKLLVISEAAARLGDQAVMLCPGVPWPNVRGIGNRIRHGYDSVNPAIIWNTVQDHLPPLRATALRGLNPSLRKAQHRSHDLDDLAIGSPAYPVVSADPTML